VGWLRVSSLESSDCAVVMWYMLGPIASLEEFGWEI
jgi:hypothetical protein